MNGERVKRVEAISDVAAAAAAAVVSPSIERRQLNPLR